MATVTISAEAFVDVRFEVFADLWNEGQKAGQLARQIDGHSALSRFARVWLHCTERQIYEVAPNVLDHLLGCPGAHAWAVTAELADLSTEGIVRIRGLSGRIEWLGKLRENARKGGAATRSKWEGKAEGQKAGQLAPVWPAKLPGPLTSASASASASDLKRSDSQVLPHLEVPVTQLAEGSSLPIKPAKAPSPEALEVGAYLLTAIRSHTPNFSPGLLPSKWARDIDLALRVDGRTVAQMASVIDEAHRSADPFWRSNLLSGKKLREKFDQLWVKAQQRGGRNGTSRRNDDNLSANDLWEMSQEAARRGT